MRTPARIAITFTGAVMLTAEIAAPSAHADRGLAGGKDFWAMAQEAALFPRRQQGPEPERKRLPLLAMNGIIITATGVRAPQAPDVAEVGHAEEWVGNTWAPKLADRGGNIWIETVAPQEWLYGTTGGLREDRRQVKWFRGAQTDEVLVLRCKAHENGAARRRHLERRFDAMIEDVVDRNAEIDAAVQ